MSVDKLLRNQETNSVELHMQLSRLQQASLDDIVATLNKSRYAASLFEEKHLHQALVSARQDIQDPAVVIIGKIFDAELNIKIEDGGMEAIAELKPAKGGKTLSPSDVAKAFAKAGIKHGLNPKAIDLLSEHSARRGGPRKVRCTIAKATPAVYGKDGKLEQLTPTLKDRILRPKMTGAGKVDPRDFGAIISVAEGAPLLRRIPAIQGKEGTTVTGNPIPPPDVEDFELTPLEGSEFKEGDENTLVATRLGIPVLAENGMKVVDTLELEAVNNYTGHIDYEGNVVVKNDVSEGMRIIVGGDVLIMGNIEGCTIEAKGDITIEKGAYGQFGSDTTSTNCHITARGSVVIGMAQNVNITAGTNIHIKKQAMHCHFLAQESLFIGLKAPNEGTLIGGSVTVGKGLYCGELGAPAGVSSHVNLSLSYNKVLKELQQAKAELIEEETALAELNQERLLLLEQASKPEIQAQLEMATSFFKEQKAVVEAKQHNVQVVHSKLSRTAESVEVVISKKVFSGLEFSLAKQWALTTNRDYGPSRLYYSGNSLQLDPYVSSK